jgi:hypothetical protein
MRFTMIFFAIVFFAGACAAATVMRSDIQIIIMVACFGFAVTFIGIAAVIHEIIHRGR